MAYATAIILIGNPRCEVNGRYTIVADEDGYLQIISTLETEWPFKLGDYQVDDFWRLRFAREKILAFRHATYLSAGSIDLLRYSGNSILLPTNDSAQLQYEDEMRNSSTVTSLPGQ